MIAGSRAGRLARSAGGRAGPGAGAGAGPEAECRVGVPCLGHGVQPVDPGLQERVLGGEVGQFSPGSVAMAGTRRCLPIAPW
ncbi:hypothetical protein [Actinomadura rubrisoli]|uniref:hypothetical protein n=1 Tax=Actinomadura rubrisoli TaxID=2530368 RepID=UPI001A9FA6EF|nr:hypothetical protein [Actinomadura rubrisoli]